MLEDDLKLRKQMLEAVSKSSLLQFMAHNSHETADLRSMLERAALVNFAPNMLIIQEGEKSHSMYFLAAGEVEILRQGKHLCRLNRMGDVFGEFGAITGEARTASVRAVNRVTCLVTDPELTGRLADEGNSAFLHVMQQALSQVLMGRLNVTSEALAVAEARMQKQDLALATLKRKFEKVQQENENLHAQLSAGMYGTRGARTKPGK
ncbi:MAG: cyclic nucleotide-binding domain-containing protein [Candidatus Hydrogenedentes bacterium]|nr:cyclic nucleotide-binding domain-containing protein [Candidatus Hydrogenedentota bacterium]